MLRVVHKITRQNLDHPFFKRSERVKALVIQAIKDGKLVRESLELSKDELTLTYTAIWRSEEDLTEFNNKKDVSVFIEKRRLYERQHNQVRNVISMKAELNDDQ